MRCSVLATAVVVFVACSSAHEAVVHADQLKHPSGFTFDLPDIGTSWAKETRGDLILVENDTDKLPELQMFVFAVKQEGTLAEIVARLPAEVVRPGVDLIASEVTAAKLVGATGTETIADANVAIRELILNGRTKAVAGVVQRGGRSLIVLAIPKDGIYERGVSNFRAMLHGLKPGNDRGVPKPARTTPPIEADRTYNKVALPPILGIKRVTATSTFDDKSGHDRYGAWRTVDYASVADRALGASVPATAWCEGKPNEGVGQGITIEFASPTQVDAIKVATGVWKTARLFEANNRISSLDVAIDGKTATVKPPLTRTWIELPVRRSISTIDLTIAGVTKGKMDDSCISGVAFVRNGESLAVVRGMDAAALDDLTGAVVAIQQALQPPRRVGLEKLLDFPFALREMASAEVGQADPLEYASWKALDAACQRAEHAATPVESIKCPQAAGAFEGATAAVRTLPPAQLEIVSPPFHGMRALWRLRWHGGSWHLAAIDYEPSE
jgi:hypothetical protein